MGSTNTNKIKRTRQILVCAIAVLTTVVASMTGSIVVAARTDNGFMLRIIVAAMIALLLTEGIFVGKLISLGKAGRL